MTNVNKDVNKAISSVVPEVLVTIGIDGEENLRIGSLVEGSFRELAAAILRQASVGLRLAGRR